MSDVPERIRKQVKVLVRSISRHNFAFFKELVSDGPSWTRFLRKNGKTGGQEFYPDALMEPLRNMVEFRDAVVHTQLFLAFMDKMRKENSIIDKIRVFISHWVYFRLLKRKMNKQTARRRTFSKQILV
jgi:hypothetical protein